MRLGRNNVMQHVERLHLGLTFFCPACARSFTNAPNLKRHIKTAHSLATTPNIP
jgi:uncharacterized C2H2 Zn-finger protein